MSSNRFHIRQMVKVARNRRLRREFKRQGLVAA